MATGSIITWVVYERPPIDYWWEFLPTVADVAVRMASDGAQEAVEDWLEATPLGIDNATAFVKCFHKAQDLARMHGWEGAFREPARVLWLPEAGSPAFTHAFVWKQDHNGMTYVISPHPLPWLGEPTPPRPSRSLGDIFASGEFAGS